MIAINQGTIIDNLSAKIKLIRVESNYTQEKMATVLGISKKSLVQIEKRWNNANWTTIVALCALFRHSDIIRITIGEDVLKTLETVVHKKEFGIK